MMAPAPIQRLNEKQREVLHLVSKGLRNSEVGHHLHLSERSIKGYVSQLFLIFDVTNRTELVAAFYESSDDNGPEL